MAGSTSPASVNPGTTHQVSCDYGDGTYGYIFGNNCNTFAGFRGTAAVFNCTAPNTPGSYAQSCQLATGPTQNYCARNVDPAGTLTVIASQSPPSLISLTPTSGSGNPQTFTATISNPNGAADISTMYIMVGPDIQSVASCCFIDYEGQTNIVTIWNDAGTGPLPGLTVGAAGTVSNSQCSLVGSSQTKVGNTLTLNVTLKFNSATYAGTQNVFITAFDQLNSQPSPYQMTGTWTVPSTVTVSSAPSGLSFTVDNVSYTSPQTFQWTAGSPHNIGTTGTQTGAGGAQYVFSNWSDGGTISHSVSPASSASYTANFSASGGGGPGWYNTGGTWTNRRKITIYHTQVAGGADLLNFPALVSIADPELKSAANGGKVGKSDGTDILFTAADGTTKQSHELDGYSAAAGSVAAWVQIPDLSASADTAVYMYYGNASAGNQQNPTQVWDSTFKMVLHGGDGTTLNVNDSTSTGNNATNNGTTAAAGKIGGSLHNTGAVTTGLSFTAPIGVFDLNTYTYSAWVNLTSCANPQNQQNLIFSIGARSFLVDTDCTIKGSITTTGSYRTAYSSSTISTGTWRLLTETYNSSDNLVHVFLDGAEVPYATHGPGGGTSSDGSNIALMNTWYNNYGGNFYGNLDEIRIANVVRSGGWIQTEFNNQNSPSTFYTVGGSESGSGGGGQSPTTVTWNPWGFATVTNGQNAVQKTGGQDTVADSGGFSQQQIASGDGYVEFTIDGITPNTTFCLNDPTSMQKYVFQIVPSISDVEVRETTGYLYRTDTRYVVGDVFRIQVTNGVVTYSKNGTLLYTSTLAPAYPLTIKTTLSGLNAIFGNTRIFLPPPVAPVTVPVRDREVIPGFRRISNMVYVTSAELGKGAKHIRLPYPRLTLWWGPASMRSRRVAFSRTRRHHQYADQLAGVHCLDGPARLLGPGYSKNPERQCPARSACCLSAARPTLSSSAGARSRARSVAGYRILRGVRSKTAPEPCLR